MKRIISILLALFITALAFAGCSAKNTEIPETTETTKTAETQTFGDITEANLASVCGVLKSAGLSNTDVFEKWVTDYLSGSAENADSSGFSDADCRMTVMLLAGDSITSESVEEQYDGTYLMFDVEAIENQEPFAILKDKEPLFTTLFGEMPITDGDFGSAFPQNLKKYGIKFGGEKFSVISLVFKAYEEDYAFVGHTGILIDCRNIESVDSNYLFVEKIAFNDVYKATKVNDEGELLEMLSKRDDYSVEEGEPNPLVYKNDRLIGELKYENRN